jgi:hypothetical protein
MSLSEHAWKEVLADAVLVYGKPREELAFHSGDVIVLCRVRNGEQYIEPFVEHYSRLGVKHIFFLDNNSTDNTLSLASRFSNVSVYQTTLPYKAYKMAFVLFMIHEFGRACWALNVDVDEFFDYPYSEFVSLGQLISYLDASRFDAVAGHMLDMFPDELSEETLKEQHAGFRDEHRFFDYSDMRRTHTHPAIEKNSWSNPSIPFYMGGVRKFWFGLESTILTKFPLVRFREGIRWESIHQIENARVANISTVLFHYKFRSDFRAFVAKAVQEKNYNKNSRAYQEINNYLQGGEFVLPLPPSRKAISDTHQLVQLELMSVSPSYIEMAKNGLTSSASGSREKSIGYGKAEKHLHQLLDTALSLAEDADRQIASAKAGFRQELNRELKRLKSTNTWKTGTLIVRPLKWLLGWLLKK